MADPSKLVKLRKTMTEEIREEYGYVFCRECSKSSGFRNLEWHHIIWRSEAPGHNNLHSRENLILVCNHCHDDFHTNKSKRNKLVQKRNLTEVFKGLKLATWE